MMLVMQIRATLILTLMVMILLPLQIIVLVSRIEVRQMHQESGARGFRGIGSGPALRAG